MYSLAVMAYEVIMAYAIFSIFVFREEIFIVKEKWLMSRIFCDYDCAFFLYSIWMTEK